MMHELAHCKQMNHSRYFWNERNRFAVHMEELWAAGYKGEGLWGRGVDLTSGGVVSDRMPDDVDIPEHLCGGTYRRGRRGKKKPGQDSGDKPKLTYAERQQRRIAKKFGTHGDGQSLGEDDLVRGALEHGGKRHQGKPRVANSKRGRELRASAALARFDAMKKQPPLRKDGDDSETDSGEDDDDEFADGLDIFSTFEKIKDQRGRELYKVCGDEGEQDEGGQTEMNELSRIRMEENGELGGGGRKKPVSERSRPAKRPAKRPYQDSETESDGDDAEYMKQEQPKPAKRQDQHQDSEMESEEDEEEANGLRPAGQTKTISKVSNVRNSPCELAVTAQPIAAGLRKETAPIDSNGSAQFQPAITSTSELAIARDAFNCPICSLENDLASSTCMACSNVLKPSLMRNSWRCKSATCKGSKYVNAADVGRCGVCGAQKPAAAAPPMGITNGDVLRWD